MTTNLSRRALFRGMASAAFAAVVAKVGLPVPKSELTGFVSGLGTEPADDAPLQLADLDTMVEGMQSTTYGASPGFVPIKDYTELEVVFITGDEIGHRRAL